MSSQDIWAFLQKQLSRQCPVAMLYVLDSQGSSPGRQGFRMMVSQEGAICGSIGGGIMEHKLVERARQMLESAATAYWLRKQVHRKEDAEHRSGMICSGEQLVLIWPIYELSPTLEALFAALEEGKAGVLELSQQGISFSEGGQRGMRELDYRSESDWRYRESLGDSPWVHIIGAGHVGLALSQQMALIGFKVAIYDDRPGLNTMLDNQFARRKQLVDYAQIREYMELQPEDCIVIMTFGYRSDKLILRQLLEQEVFYIGMMGSAAKIDQLFAELVAEGLGEDLLSRVYAPIGLPIYSKKPEEIAVSIAGQIIAKRNKDLPTGRKGKV